MTTTSACLNKSSLASSWWAVLILAKLSCYGTVRISLGILSFSNGDSYFWLTLWNWLSITLEVFAFLSLHSISIWLRRLIIPSSEISIMLGSESSPLWAGNLSSGFCSWAPPSNFSSKPASTFLMIWSGAVSTGLALSWMICNSSRSGEIVKLFVANYSPWLIFSTSWICRRSCLRLAYCWDSNSASLSHWFSKC